MKTGINVYLSNVYLSGCKDETWSMYRGGDIGQEGCMRVVVTGGIGWDIGYCTAIPYRLYDGRVVKRI